MPGCVQESLPQFNHKTPKKSQNQPYPVSERTFGADTQKKKPIDMSLSLPVEIVKIFDTIIEKFFYYERGVYNTCLVPLSTMSTRSDSTEQDEKLLHPFLDYMARYPNAVVIFHASDMILRADTN